MRINKSFIALTSSDASVSWSNITGTPTTLSGYGITDGVPTSRTLTINGVTYDLSSDRSWSVGTVTSVGLSSATSGVTIGSTPVTSSGTITLTIATASGSQNGLLSSTDWTTFNSKFNLPSLTSGSVLFSNGTTIAQDNANFFWDNTNKRLGIGINTPTVMIEAYKSSANAEIYANYNNTNIVRLNAASNGTGYIGVIGGTGDLALGTTNYTTALVISGSNGSVLINTSSNSGEKLQVNGTSKLYGNVTTYGENGVELLWSGNTINDQRQGRIRPISTPSPFPYAGGLAFDYYSYSGTAYQYYEGLRLNGNGEAIFYSNLKITGTAIEQDNSSGLTINSSNASGSIKFRVAGSERASISNTGAATFSSLSGTGTRMVVADSSGVLSASTIVTSGTYTPTLTNVANISSSNPDLCTYSRIGSIVAVQGYLTLTPTTGSLTTTIGISLPIASNFNAATDASGIYVSTSNDRFGGIDTDQTNDRVQISFTASSNGSRGFYFTFQYQIK